MAQRAVTVCATEREQSQLPRAGTRLYYTARIHTLRMCVYICACSRVALCREQSQTNQKGLYKIIRMYTSDFMVKTSDSINTLSNQTTGTVQSKRYKDYCSRLAHVWLIFCRKTTSGLLGALFSRSHAHTHTSTQMHTHSHRQTAEAQ